MPLLGGSIQQCIQSMRPTPSGSITTTLITYRSTCLAAQTSDNPFKLRFVTEVRGGGRLDDSGPCVVLATPSMLQSGLSRELFDAWCEDPRNGIVICDFAVQGTLAREIQSSPSHVITKAGAKVQLIPCRHQALWRATAPLLPLQHSGAATSAVC